MALIDLENPGAFEQRHTGPNADQEALMLSAIGAASRAALLAEIVPASIARETPMALPPAVGEPEALRELQAIASQNEVCTSWIGQGYYGTHTPGVILRNILENPAWYTAYTPYQAEISQGRMEALVNFQTMVCDLTGMPIANASMLDEATAAAEAMTLAKRSVKSKGMTIVVSGECHPQTIEVIQTRAAPLGMTVIVPQTPADWATALARTDYFAVVCQYPSTFGRIDDISADVAQVHANQAAFIVAADLLALTLVVPPGEVGADIVVGTTQRLGMPMGNGGPHAAYMACRDELKRSLPGRLVGVSVDAHGAPAYRLALQTREQHIRREKATSNICTAQVLPAVVASMYAVYHGPVGLTRIAKRVATYTAILAKGLQTLGHVAVNASAFDTLTYSVPGRADGLVEAAYRAGGNLRRVDANTVALSLDETTTRADLETLWRAFGASESNLPSIEALGADEPNLIPAALRR
ncbi:MAG: aminomethyl-transferring glycine dehydrogenase subunit GcvPA, partial [Burkholderiaceae bacterium]